MFSAQLRCTILTILCSGLILLAGGCSESKRSDEAEQPTSPSKYGGVYRRPLRNEPVTLDPAFVTSTYAVSVVQQLFDGLVQYDADLNVLPAIATSWSASRDGLTWTFHLRRGVKFHHGREVKAADFVYSFTRIVDPKTKSPRTWLFERVRGAREFLAGTAKRVEGFRALDDYTLQITLSAPYASFVNILGIAQPKVLPREEIERLGEQFGHHPVGTGPFRFVNWVPGKEINLEANEAYFEERPFLDRLHYRIFPGADREAILAAFEQGQLEDMRVFTPQRQRLINDSRYQFFRKPLLATLFLWLNTRAEPLNDVRVRQAINYAINRDAINRTIRKNRFVLARGILPPGMPGYNPELRGYDYDPARAKKLLAEAGYPEGKGFPPLELWSSVISSTALAEHEAVKRDLQHLGITVELRTVGSWKLFETEVLGKIPRAMYRYAWHADLPDPDNFLFILFHSQSSSNYANYANPEVDRLLERAQRESDDFTRLQLYRQAEELIMADAPMVNLVYYTREHLFQLYVGGVELNALGEPYVAMKKIWLDTTHHAFPKPAKSE